MATIRQNGFDDNDNDYSEPFKMKLINESRQTGTISRISEVRPREDKFDGGEYEEIIFFVEVSIDELDIPHDADRDALREAVQTHYDDEDRDYVEFPLFCKAKVTRGGSGQYSDSKLYETLYKLGLVEPNGDVGFEFKSADGEKVSPFEGVGDDNDAINEALEAYLEENAQGLRVEWEVKNSNVGKDNEYSAVGKIVRRLRDGDE